ncbi:MAG: hypothetical protein GY893_13400, partial [bacterium]|nr:hypothetical protein [bacterium]
TYTIPATDEGKKIRSTISYKDSQGFAEEVTAAAVDIPYVDNGDAIFSISGTTTVGQSLSVVENSPDPDGSGSISYNWQTSSDNSTWSEVGSNSTYTIKQVDEGKGLRSILSYKDGQTFAEQVTTTAINIPYVDNGEASFAINGTSVVGQTLSITESNVDPDGTGTLSYNWQTSSNGSTWSQVGTNSTYTIPATDEGKKIRSIISYKDSQGFAEEVTVSAIDIPYVDNGAASFSLSGIAKVGQSLSVVENSPDPDGSGT